MAKDTFMFFIKEVKSVVIFCDSLKESENRIINKTKEHNINIHRIFYSYITMCDNFTIVFSCKKDMFHFKLIFGEYFQKDPSSIIDWEPYCLNQFHNNRNSMIFGMTGASFP